MSLGFQGRRLIKVSDRRTGGNSAVTLVPAGDSSHTTALTLKVVTGYCGHLPGYLQPGTLKALNLFTDIKERIRFYLFIFLLPKSIQSVRRFNNTAPQVLGQKLIVCSFGSILLLLWTSASVPTYCSLLVFSRRTLKSRH